MQYNTQYTKTNNTIWLGPGSGPYSSGIYVKQDGLLYYGAPLSKYLFFGAILLAATLIYRLESRTSTSGSRLLIGMGMLTLSAFFYYMGLYEMKRMRAALTDINNLAKQPLSWVVLICGVNRITNKHYYYLVNCVYMQVNSNGELLPQKKGNIMVPKNLYSVGSLMQEFVALHRRDRIS